MESDLAGTLTDMARPDNHDLWEVATQAALSPAQIRHLVTRHRPPPLDSTA